MPSANANQFLILQHEVDTPPGTLITWLEQKGFAYHLAFAPKVSRSEWLDLFEFENLIVLGGSMNVDQEDELPWLRDEKTLILTYLAMKKKALGLCLGGQLLAEALGGAVGPAPQWEAGFFPIEWLHDDFSFGQSLDVFQWHGYQFTTPPGGHCWARSTSCAAQAFNFESHVVGLQFHPESSLEFIFDCATKTSTLDYPTGPFVQTPEQILSSYVNQQRALQIWFFKFLDRFFIFQNP
jgi:GMP synthase-like glutamine amidotransferase